MQSNCVAVVPLETEFGRKRQIDQSACNKDFSCTKGFCPSFVTVHGGKLRKGKASANLEIAPPALPEPAIVEVAGRDKPYSILVNGVGGTGIVTVGAILGMAAHLEGKGCGILEMTGLAQKGGAVLSHVRIARDPKDIAASKINAGGADVMIGGDLLVSGGGEAYETLRRGTRAVINTHEMITGAFTRNSEFRLPSAELRLRLESKLGRDNACFLDATQIATKLMGDSIAANLFLVGFVYQKGWLPVSAGAIERAIELNGAAVEMNKTAFLWGRRAAADQATVERIAFPPGAQPKSAKLSETLEELIKRRAQHLTRYQDARYAARYEALVARVRAVEGERIKGKQALSEAVARYYAKLLAYKDEYEVARLYTSGEFERKLTDLFDGDYRLKFHMAPPLLAKRDPTSGQLQKRAFGPWVFSAFKLLAKLKGLRGTTLDIFGHTEERRTERRLIVDYERMLDELLAGLNEDNHALAVELASVPEQIRGFGHVKQRYLQEAKKREAELLARWRAPAALVKAAA